MTTPWERFKQAARLEEPDQIPVALIVDSPWLPGYAGMHTLDFFLNHERWYEVHRSLLDRFPDVVWIPGFWVEYGMAAEPSAFGCRIHFHPDRPPSMTPMPTRQPRRLGGGSPTAMSPLAATSARVMPCRFSVSSALSAA